MTIAIWWIRRDLRLSDNPALINALTGAAQVIPVFILDPYLMNSPFSGEKRLAFLLEGLRQLDSDLRKRGSYLVLRQGDPHQVFTNIAVQFPFISIFAEEDYSPYARSRDARIRNSFPYQTAGSPAVYPPYSLLKSDGSPYAIFTPYNRIWKSFLDEEPPQIHPTPDQIPTPPGIASLPLPTQPDLASSIPFLAGEKHAQRTLNAFFDGSEAKIFDYDEARDRMDLDGTARISPYIRFGMLSARQAAHRALDSLSYAPAPGATKAVSVWLNELAWRDFYIQILFHYPSVLKESFRSVNISWEEDAYSFSAWCQGKTGYPIVDAAMRQLVQSGWMHNRARMIVASFLTKDLLIHWRQGQQWFMRNLIDGDPASNNGGWQWTAGTGTDAAPYFRIFNPVSQSKRYDPHGSYIRRWVSELAQVPDEFIHEPWKMSLGIQKHTGFIPGKTYPHPIVDHAWARQRALSAFNRHR
jgi:deoxyribodipyrimidine photo-lyase